MATPGSPDELPYQGTAQINDLEKAFQDCIMNLTSQEHFAENESEETRHTMEQSLQHFLDTARRLEGFFLSQRLRLSVLKPEQVLREDISELRLELERKEKLVEKQQEKLQAWQTLMRSSTPAPTPTPATSATAGSSTTSQSAPTPQQSPSFPMAAGMRSQHVGGAQPGQYPGPPPMPAQGYNMPPPHHPPPSYSQNPLTYLEQNLSNIGMPERR